MSKDAPVDEDVKLEESRIASDIIGGDLVVIKNLKKVMTFFWKFIETRHENQLVL